MVAPNRPAPRDRPRRRADAVANRDALLRAAGALYAERGTAVSFDEIAVAAGVGRATLYRHFPDREALGTAVLERIVEAVEDAAAALPDDDPGAFLALLEATLRIHLDHLSLVDLLPRRDERRPEIDALRARFGALFDGPLRVARAAGVVRDDVTVDDVRVELLMLSAVTRPGVTVDERRRAWRLAHLALGAAPPTA